MSAHDSNHDEPTQRMPHAPQFAENGSVTIRFADGMLPHSDWSDKTVISTKPPSIEAAPPAFSTSQSLGQLLVGKSLDHYDLVEFVGGGGMGAVFRATDTRLGRTVAVKVLSRDHTDDETIKRFRNEATSAARLDHPNIARVYNVGEALGWNYIVFEFIEGINVRELVANEGVLRVEDALRFTLKIAEALDHASKRDVVHRDIKPSNILVTPDSDVKLVDMGLARLHQVESSSDDLTASGVTLGTFDYISPEQARDPRTADVRSDIYSLGCTLFYMLCGRPPFPDGTALQKLLWHSGEEPPEMTLFRGDLPPRLTAMVQKMLAKRPHQRFQTAADLAAEIIDLAEEAGLPPLGVAAAAPLHIAPPPRTEWMTAVAILAPFGMLAVVVLLLESLLPQSNAAVDRPFSPRLTTASVSQSEPMEPIRSSPRVEETPTPIVPKSPPTPPETAPPEERTTETPETPDPPLTKPGPVTSGSPVLDTAVAAIPAAPSPPKAKPFTKVILRPGESKPEAGVVGQLAAAVKLATEKSLNEIELAFDGPLVERSFDIPSQALNIRAAEGNRPVLVFRPKSGGLLDEQRMIRITGAGIGKVQWKGVEFQLELPADSSSLGWSLFGLAQVHTLSLEECLITIKNGGASGPIHFPVSVFEFIPPRSSEMMMEGGAAMATPTALHLEHTLVRGACSLIVMTEETPCEFVAKQSLLAVADHLFVTTGAAAKPKWHGRIEWRLEYVTVFAGRGLYQLRRRDDSSYQFDLDLRCDHCRFLLPKNAPLFEVVNGPRPADLRLQFDGVGNAYPAENSVFLRIRPKGEEQADYDLQHRQDWSNERRPRFDAVLPPAAAERPWHALTEDVFVVPSEMPPADGVDPLQLSEPTAPVAAAAPSAAVLPASGELP